jgi:lysophospholipase L1-like esterase
MIGFALQPVMRLVFLGDSTCVGQGVSIHKGWVPRLSAYVEEISNTIGANVIVVNASVNGNTTRQALERMPYEVQSHGADILVMQFGLNDCNHWHTDRGLPRVSLKGFAANLEEIIDRGAKFGARRILLNTNHPTGRNKEKLPFADCTFEDCNRAYNQIIRDVAAENRQRVWLNDMERVFLEHIGGDSDKLLKLLLPDLLHVSLSGHDLYFMTIARAVRRAILELHEERR